MTAHAFLLRAARGARRFTAISAAGAALSFAAMAAAPAAQAAAPVHRAATRVVSAAGHQAAPAVITCKIFVVIRFPHPLDATGRLTCSGIVHRITIRVTIYRGTTAVRSQAFTHTNTRTLKRTIYTTCVSGRYHAKVTGRVRTRSGHLLTGSAKTGTVTVRC